MNKGCVSLSVSLIAALLASVAIIMSAVSLSSSRQASVGTFSSIVAGTGTFQGLSSPEITYLMNASCTWTSVIKSFGIVHLRPELGPCQSQLVTSALYTYNLISKQCGANSPMFTFVEIVPNDMPAFSNGPGYYTTCLANNVCFNQTCGYSGITLDTFAPPLPLWVQSRNSVQIPQNTFIQLLTNVSTVVDLSGATWTLNNNSLSWLASTSFPITSGTFIWRLENVFKLFLSVN